MRWATYRDPGNDTVDRVGLIDGGEVRGLRDVSSLVSLLGDDGSALLRAAEVARRDPAEVLPLESVRLRPPIPRPPAIRDFSAFLEHYREGIRAVGGTFNERWFEAPVFYFSNPNCLFSDGEEVRIPANSRRMDYELEVCAVIGRHAMDVHPDEADQYIAGYSIYNDWSARDLQAEETARAPIGPGKGKDSANSIGPFLVTPDELEDARKANGFDLAMTATVNGREYSRGSWSSIYWSFGEMIAFAARNTPLVPGDIIGSGTVGTGCILELSATHGEDRFPWLAAGDEVVLEVERLGRLRNRMGLGAPPQPLRGARAIEQS